MTTRSEATQAARPLDLNLMVLWPKDRAPLRIKARCPICGAGLMLDAGAATELDDATGEWIATEIELDCESEPDIDSDEWKEWLRWHYRMPYEDWLPLEQRILIAVRRKYYFANTSTESIHDESR